MILSSFNNRTATAALRRNGSACLALEAGSSNHVALLGNWCTPGQALKAEGGFGGRDSSSKRVFGNAASFGVSLSIFGGSPFCATYASKQGLVSNVSRMPAAAPITLDPSANQEGGA